MGVAATWLAFFIYKPTYSDIQPQNYLSNIDVEIKMRSEDPSVNVSNIYMARMADTPSMLPTLPNGAKIFISEDYNISIGDIIIIDLENITKNYDGNRTAHRIVDMDVKDDEICYITQGDNVRYDDGSCFTKNETYGKVVGVLY